MAGANLAAPSPRRDSGGSVRPPVGADRAGVRRWQGGIGVCSGHRDWGRCLDGPAPEGCGDTGDSSPSSLPPSPGTSHPGSPCGRARRCGTVPDGACAGLQPRSLQAVLVATLSAHGFPASCPPPGQRRLGLGPAAPGLAGRSSEGGRAGGRVNGFGEVGS